MRTGREKLETVTTGIENCAGQDRKKITKTFDKWF